MQWKQWCLCVNCCTEAFVHSPPLGLISRVQVTIEYKKYSVFVLLRLWRMGEVKDTDDAYEICWHISSLM